MIPRFFLALIAVAPFQPGLVIINVVLGLTSWPMKAQLIRGQVLSGREREYVLAARTMGGSAWHMTRDASGSNAGAPRR